MENNEENPANLIQPLQQVSSIQHNETVQSQQNVMDSFRIPLVTNGVLANQTMDINPQLLLNELPNQFPYPYPLPYQIPLRVPRLPLTKDEKRLRLFWASQLHEIDATKDFKNHTLPLARIKKIMKADEEVKMIASETPLIFSKACEMFILELTHRACYKAELCKRRTLVKSDICQAVANQPMFDFLVDILPREEAELGGAAGAGMFPGAGELDQSLPFFYDPSNFSSFMMNMRHPEMEPHDSSFTQQHQYDIPSESEGTAPPSSSP